MIGHNKFNKEIHGPLLDSYNDSVKSAYQNIDFRSQVKIGGGYA